jgi:1-deoxy-D-xylulose-5-phosphate reductoisomerase
LGKLEFREPDFKKFPCLGLAYAAARSQGTAPCVLNAANEVAVEAFLGRRLLFSGISGVVERVLARQRNISRPTLEDISNQDAWAREEALKLLMAQ